LCFSKRTIELGRGSGASKGATHPTHAARANGVIFSAEEEFQKKKAGANASLSKEPKIQFNPIGSEVDLRHDLTQACSAAWAVGNSESGEIGNVRSDR